VMQSVGCREPAEIVRHVEALIAEWTGGRAIHDDVTLVVMKIRANGTPGSAAARSEMVEEASS
jgi:hypothetical protein